MDENEAEEGQEEAKPEEAEGEVSEEAIEKAEEEKAEGEEVEAEEAKPPSKRALEEEEVVEERFYTIPLGKAWLVPPNRRAAKAIRILRDFIKRHMKIEAAEEGEEPKKLIISNEVNEEVWRGGVEKPPRKIHVRAARDKDGNVAVYLAEGD